MLLSLSGSAQNDVMAELACTADELLILAISIQEYRKYGDFLATLVNCSLGTYSKVDFLLDLVKTTLVK